MQYLYFFVMFSFLFNSMKLVTRYPDNGAGIAAHGKGYNSSFNVGLNPIGLNLHGLLLSFVSVVFLVPLLYHFNTPVLSLIIALREIYHRLGPGGERQAGTPAGTPGV